MSFTTELRPVIVISYNTRGNDPAKSRLAAFSFTKKPEAAEETSGAATTTTTNGDSNGAVSADAAEGPAAAAADAMAIDSTQPAEVIEAAE